jgi:hypothetical protein
MLGLIGQILSTQSILAEYRSVYLIAQYNLAEYRRDNMCIIMNIP